MNGFIDLDERPLVGVYALVDGAEVVYVGQSLDVRARVATHRQSTKVFTHALYLSVDPSNLDAYEGALIRCLKPRYCSQAPASRGGDAEILASLGLTVTDETFKRPSAPASKTVARCIQKWRADSRLTQRQLAARIGVTPAAVAQWELGQSEPKHARIEAMAEVFGVTVSQFWEAA